ncbi:hypothetical protein JCM18899A_22790 [Nocardioides sp. AN3]
MSAGDDLLRAPKQARSRQSLDRALDATLALLVQRGSGAFGIADVARLAGVSTGSIYGRVASKDDLIRVAHAREMDRIDLETARAFASGREPACGLDEAVRREVGALAGLLRRNARVLAPFMLLGRDDPVIAARGTAAHERMQAAFIAALREMKGGPAGAGTDDPLRWACTVAWSVLARQLGLGNDREAAADYEYDEVVDRLSAMLTAYLADGMR